MEHVNNNKSKIRVIIIEDHKLMRVGLKSLFEKHGDIVVITEADNGRDGIEKVLINKPDVAIIDIGLNDMSGVDAAKKILSQNDAIKIMILTSNLIPADVIEALKAGVLAYVLKDINSDMLISILRSVNMGAMWLDAKVVPILREENGGLIPQKTKNRASFKAAHANLTEREYEVLKLVVDGKSNYEIAQILKISEHTSKAHVCNIIQKLVVDDRTQAAVKAIKEGLV